MRTSLALLALSAIGYAAPTPQDIDFDAVDAAQDPVIVVPSFDVATQGASVLAASAVATSAAAAVTTQAVASDDDSSDDDSSTDDSSDVGSISRRSTTCKGKQAVGAGPVPTPDTASAFAALATFSAISSSANTPDGYTESFSGSAASIAASNYMGLYTLTSYDTLSCASYCDRTAGCQSFNIYAERDPLYTIDATACPNPASTTNYKCTLWGVPIVVAEATTTGPLNASFQYAIAASNGYVKNTAPAAVASFDGPFELGGAVNAPYGYLGMRYYPFSQSQGYTPSTCAAVCQAQTAYDKAHPRSDGSYDTCAFFNAYVLSNDSIPQGLYCSFYNQTWSSSYATNYGQYRGSDRFTVSQSYSYSLQSVLSAEAIISSQSLQPFCSSLLNYVVPTTTVTSYTTSASTTVQTIAITNTVTTVETDISTALATTTSYYGLTKRSLATPTALSAYNSAIVSSACNAAVASPTSTVTVFTTSTSFSVETDAATTFVTVTATSDFVSTTTVLSTAVSTPTFAILSAFFAQEDVTDKARAAYLQGNNIVIDTSDAGLLSALGADPWVNVLKSLVILYSYGSELRVWTSHDGQSSTPYTITPGPISSAPGSTLAANLTAPAGSAIQILAVTWGVDQITTSSVYSALYAAYAANSKLAFSNSFFGIDGLPGWAKTGTVWYTLNGNLESLVMREYTSAYFPTTGSQHVTEM